MDVITQSLEEARNNHFILRRQEGRTLLLQLNRPKRFNSFTMGMYRQLTQILNAAKQDDSVTTVVLHGAGKHFCSGNDLSNFTKMIGGDIEDMLSQAIRLLQKFILAVVHFDKPLFAVTHGITLGFAFTMLPFFDRVISEKGATFEAPFVKLLQNPEFGSSVTFPKLFGLKITKQLFFEGKKLTVQDLQRFQFATRVDTKEEGLKLALELALKYNSMDLDTLRCNKRLVQEQVDEVILRENKALRERWAHPSFLGLLSSTFRGKL